jgi:hypothetical protein
MATPELPPDAQAVRAETLRIWHECTLGRHENLTNWSAQHTPDGALWLSAQAVGPDPAMILKRVAEVQASFLSGRITPGSGHQLPALDVSQPGRTAYVWRSAGVWVEMWHTTQPSPPRPTPAVLARSATAAGRRGLGGPLPWTRNRSAETKPA